MVWLHPRMYIPYKAKVCCLENMSHAMATGDMCLHMCVKISRSVWYISALTVTHTVLLHTYKAGGSLSSRPHVLQLKACQAADALQQQSAAPDPLFIESMCFLQALGGAKYMFLTHRDDVADHVKWQAHLGCERIIHELEANASQQTTCAP